MAGGAPASTYVGPQSMLVALPGTVTHLAVYPAHKVQPRHRFCLHFMIELVVYFLLNQADCFDLCGEWKGAVSRHKVQLLLRFRRLRLAVRFV